MTLEILPMVEADMDAYFDIIWAAFAPGLMALMYPNGFTASAREQSKQSYLREWQRHPERTKMMKVVDHSLPETHPGNKIIGVSKWRFFTRDRSEAELAQEKAEAAAEPAIPDHDGPVCEAFGAAVSKCKDEIVGRKAYALLYIVGVAPEHHRRGVGKMHLNWGLREADRLNIPVYLEASEMGRPLYERMGFESLKTMPFDARDFGYPESLEHTCMLRPVKGKKATSPSELKTAQSLSKSTPSSKPALHQRKPMPSTGHAIEPAIRHCIPNGISA
ncbi:Hypothetical protein R9X50_00439500 [Acrodontium crateriforme]|uniref:N-acetyltransferase domain-containing protein n=1 Tax=Acrodontium crateriforme TaxID=150365 RepID=A0AAQ3M5D0_9PEZI|nr:Hypothetical protein R9X50_00439500 [Acrodontium crateriforme]